MAVGDDVDVVGECGQSLDLVGSSWPTGCREERGHLDVSRPGNVTLARIARRAGPAGELLRTTDVDQGERRVVEAPSQLVQCGERVEPRLELDPRLVEDDRALVHGTLPRREASGEHCDVRMPGQLDHLECRGGGDAAAFVVEHEPLFARDAVATQPQSHLTSEGLDEVRARELAGRADHERDRARQVTTGVSVRPAHIGKQDVVVARVLCHPVRSYDGRAHTASEATTSTSAAIAGRSASRSPQAAIAG